MIVVTANCPNCANQAQIACNESDLIHARNRVSFSCPNCSTAITTVIAKVTAVENADTNT